MNAPQAEPPKPQPTPEQKRVHEMHVRIEAMTQGDLLARRAALVAKGNGRPGDLPDEELEELVAIFALLRRKTSGPPATSKRKASTKAPLEQLL